MPAAEKTAIGRKRRGMHCFEHQMPVAIDKYTFFLRVRAPKQEDQLLTFSAERRDDLIGVGKPSGW